MVGILSNGPHTCVVTPRVRSRGDAGEPVWTDGSPVTVSGGMMQPAGSSENNVQGTTVSSLWRWISEGPWPGGPHSVVEWKGRKFDQIGSAQEFSIGQFTRHVEVMLSERSVEAK